MPVISQLFHEFETTFDQAPQGLYSLRRRRLINIGIPIINLRRSSDRLRFIMGIPIPVRRRLLSEEAQNLRVTFRHLLRWCSIWCYCLIFRTRKIQVWSFSMELQFDTSQGSATAERPSNFSVIWNVLASNTLRDDMISPLIAPYWEAKGRCRVGDCVTRLGGKEDVELIDIYSHVICGVRIGA